MNTAADRASQAAPTGAKSWHSRSADDVADAMATDLDAGLSTSEAARRLGEHGPNRLAATPRWVRLRILVRQFTDILIWLLIAAALISGLLLDSWVDALAIFSIVVLNAAIGYFQEARARTTLDRLADLEAPMARILRNGEIGEIPASEVVPGDLVLLEPGDRVPADGRVAWSIRLLVDEAALTGESAPASKSVEAVEERAGLGDRTPMVHAGTLVVGGRGRLVTTATGANTEMGRIAQLASGAPSLTPLEVDVRKIGKRIAVLAAATAALVFAVGLARGFGPEAMVLTAIALAVAAIPEGLPAVITVSLAGGLQRMAKRSAIIRRLAAVEALGAVDVICTDKTGTLTLPRLRVAELMLGDGSRDTAFNVGGDGPGRLLALTAVLCNDARLTGEDHAGDPVEVALLQSATQAGIDVGEIRSRHPRLDEAGFDGQRKRMSTIHEVDGRTMLLVKGAPEVLIGLAATVMADGEPTDLDDAARDRVLAVAERMAADGMRTLGFAVRELPCPPADPARAEQDLLYLGTVGMREEIRPEVPAAVAAAGEAGVRSVMVTGDHASTAAAVAEAVGITGGRVMTGSRLTVTTLDDLSAEIAQYHVFARVDPVDKVKIVEAWKRAGARVAMTGDGVNDAPALRKADIGIAMGSGTEVAKEAASVVLADDNYATIVAAIAEGRRLFANLRNVIHYLLSANASEVIYILLGFALFGHLGEPLLAVQLLWINLVSDSFPAIALGADQPARDPMNVPPGTGRDVLSGANLARLGIQGAVLAAGAFVSFLAGTYLLELGAEGARTMVFTTLVFSQLLHALSVRADAPVGATRPGRGLILALIGSAALHLIVLYTPLFADVFRIVALGVVPMAWAAGASLATSVAVRLIMKTWRRH